ncbi:biotin transporter BioY [Tenuibacillus multivorans]|uniref:Biotin transporter n=1 Tax=Tenuibacillus multivorans TaxID=237069 RepID=A0A1H0FSJ5_9BACI|nr:biotin transporter BioY [Tenuibacillus multivorans]GEL77899.1 BioY family transporter [Tenuibacillus multivorans]SDN97643.1 biotin transport system substrate-specific component [Tenuibacillus multivorans]
MNSKFRAIDLTLGAVFVVLMMIGANLATWFPAFKITYASGEVPITLQTFFAILAGLLLGKKLGSFSMLVYLAVGTAGVPVFAEMTSGAFQFVSPTGGFLISFIFVAFISGWIVEKSNQPNIGTYLVATFAGLMTNYLIGTPIMYLSLNYVMEMTISFKASALTMVPFFIKDFIITMGMAVVLPQFVSRLSKAVPTLASRS